MWVPGQGPLAVASIVLAAQMRKGSQCLPPHTHPSLPEAPRTFPSDNADAPQSLVLCPLLGRLLSCLSNDISSLGKKKAGSKPLHKEFHFKPCIELFLGQPELGSKDCEKSPLSPLPLRRLGSHRGDIWKEGPFPLGGGDAVGKR